VRDRRQAQRGFADGFLSEQVDEFWDDWMRAVDQVLDDDDLVATVYEALVARRAQSRTRGRPGFPADVVLRLLLLKHMRNWSFAILEREVRTNLLYRQFTRVGGGKVPDAKTLGRLAPMVGPDAVARLQQRVVAGVGARGDAVQDLHHLPRVGSSGEDGLLGPAQLGRRDHLHGLGDLLRVLDRADPAP